MIKIEQKTSTNWFEIYVKPECILEIAFDRDAYATIKVSTQHDKLVVDVEQARAILNQLNEMPQDEHFKSDSLNDTGSVFDLLDYDL